MGDSSKRTQDVHHRPDLAADTCCMAVSLYEILQQQRQQEEEEERQEQHHHQPSSTSTAASDPRIPQAQARNDTHADPRSFRAVVGIQTEEQSPPAGKADGSSEEESKLAARRDHVVARNAELDNLRRHLLLRANGLHAT